MARLKVPSIAAVAEVLRAINGDECDECGDDSDCIDVRLQIMDGTWEVHSGDPQYDTDHRGFWGAASVPGNGRRFNSREIARDLIDQVRDQHAQSDEE